MRSLPLTSVKQSVSKHGDGCLCMFILKVLKSMGEEGQLEESQWNHLYICMWEARGVPGIFVISLL